jgi:hypothetical protein
LGGGEALLPLFPLLPLPLFPLLPFPLPLLPLPLPLFPVGTNIKQRSG